MLQSNLQHNRIQSGLAQFETFRNPNQAHLIPSLPVDQQKQGLLLRISELERQISMTNERSRQLETLNGKLKQIIIDHHTKDNKDVDRFINKITKILEKQSSNHTNHSIDKENPKSTRNSSRQRQTNNQNLSHLGRVKTQQSTFTDQNCSFIGNACLPLTKLDLKKKLANKLTYSHLK